MRPIDADIVQQMIDEVEERFEKKPAEQGFGKKYFNCKSLRYFIDKFSTLDVVPVVHARWEEGNGEWFEMLRDWYLRPTYICSNCREEERRKTPYCPNCGACMDLGVQDET